MRIVTNALRRALDETRRAEPPGSPGAAALERALAEARDPLEVYWSVKRHMRPDGALARGDRA